MGRRPKIVKDPAFVKLMLAAMVMHERWDDVRAAGYSDEEIQKGIDFITAKMDSAASVAAVGARLRQRRISLGLKKEKGKRKKGRH